MGVSPDSSAACVRLRTVSSVSAKYWRRSLWPRWIGGAHGDDHGAGNFTGESAFFGPADILRTDADARVSGGIHGRGEVRERGTDHDLAVFGILDQRPEFLEKCSGFGGRLVHLPIARHDWFSHTISFKKLGPWAMLAPKLAATVCPISDSDARNPRLLPGARAARKPAAERTRACGRCRGRWDRSRDRR